MGQSHSEQIQVDQQTHLSFNRRDMLRQAGALTFGAATAPIFMHAASAQDADKDPPPAMRSSQRLATNALSIAPDLPPIAMIALNRMAFGPRPGDRKSFNALGKTDDERLEAYVNQQLAPDQIDDSQCDAILTEHGFTTLGKSLPQAWTDHVKSGENRYLPAQEVELATFLRAVYSKRQLFEVLAGYWHSHFNVYGWDYWTAPVFAHYDRAVIRAHILGNFRAMLEAVARSPAMLYYLDNQSNSGERPNENYARELFELHGMGAENYLGVRDPNDPELLDEAGDRIGYIDADVYGATTCFTGWRVDGDTGTFEFDDSRHFPYQKVVLGKIIPEFQGVKDGKDVLDMLAYHPGSARYICRRLCRRLISDDPPQRIVEEAAAVFVANQRAPDQLKRVVETILLSPEFRTTWGSKIKRPFEYVVSMLRAANADFSPNSSFLWSYGSTGQSLFRWHPPDGYPDVKEAWSSTMPMLQRWRQPNWLLSWTYGGEGDDKDVPRLRFEGQMPSTYQTPVEIADYWISRILGRSMPPQERQQIVDFMAHGRNPDFALPAEDISERLRYMVGLIFMSPSFQWR